MASSPEPPVHSDDDSPLPVMERDTIEPDLPVSSLSLHYAEPSLLDLTDLSLIYIFMMISPLDRANCSLACKRFHAICRRNKCFYKHLSPTRWAHSFTIGYDVDLLDFSSESPLFIRKYQTSEHNFFTRLLLGPLSDPEIGLTVQELDFSGSVALDNKLLRTAVIQCPLLTNLNIQGCSLITGAAFASLQQYDVCRRLQHINFQNTQIDDIGMFNLSQCWEFEQTCPLMANVEERTVGFLEYAYPRFFTATLPNGEKYEYFYKLAGEDEWTCDYNGMITFTYPIQLNLKKIAGLKSLNIAGCKKLTDKFFLNLLSFESVLNNIMFLDLSGCPSISGKVLTRFVLACPKLKPCNLYYCDYVVDGPYVEQANGCARHRSSRCCVSRDM